MNNKENDFEDMESIKSEIVKEQLQRIKQNIIPSLISAIIVVLLCIVIGTYMIKSIIGTQSFIESVQILITSLLPMLTIGGAGFIVFIFLLFMEN